MFDYCVVGAGIVGLSTCYNLIQKNPNSKILIIEKEKKIGLHQTSHNSGVVHAGIYYHPESLKARLCREGLVETELFCGKHDISYEKPGKLIVATNHIEEKRVRALYERAKKNGAKIELLGREKLKAKEPNIEGSLAIFSPDTGIVNYFSIAEKLLELVSSHVQLVVNESVVSIEENIDSVMISTESSTYKAKNLIACAGLQADRVASMAGIDLDCKIIPFRGEYFQLTHSKSQIIKHLVYPAPDPTLPFLGVHLTKMIDGSVIVGPNAVLSMAREGYKKFSINAQDIASFVGFPGFWKIIWKNRSHAFSEFKNSTIKNQFLKECQKYCPSLLVEDLLPYRAGIRAQVVSEKGEAVHDFLIKKTKRMLHVINAPSPAATSALPIGKMIAEKLSV